MINYPIKGYIRYEDELSGHHLWVGGAGLVGTGDGNGLGEVLVDRLDNLNRQHGVAGRINGARVEGEGNF